MLYNQQQRQMMIWEQRNTRRAISGSLLLVHLGLKIIGRNLGKRINRETPFILEVNG